jgi:putative endonuclease
MSAVRVRHRPPAFARFASYGSAGQCVLQSERRLSRRSPTGEGGLRYRETLRPDSVMHYVYILRTVQQPYRYYVGATADLRSRLGRHNALEVPHTSKYAPWAIKTYIAFSDEKQAFAFEKYLKSPSGRAFAKKRL